MHTSLGNYKSSIKSDQIFKGGESLDYKLTLVIPYPASSLSGIRSIGLAPEDMKMNFEPLVILGTQAWKNARAPSTYTY